MLHALELCYVLTVAMFAMVVTFTTVKPEFSRILHILGAERLVIKSRAPRFTEARVSVPARLRAAA